MHKFAHKLLRFPAVAFGYLSICVGFVLAFVGALLAKAGAYISNVEVRQLQSGLNIVIPENTDLTDEELEQFINEALEAKSKED